MTVVLDVRPRHRHADCRGDPRSLGGVDPLDDRCLQRCGRLISCLSMRLPRSTLEQRGVRFGLASVGSPAPVPMSLGASPCDKRLDRMAPEEYSYFVFHPVRGLPWGFRLLGEVSTRRFSRL